MFVKFGIDFVVIAHKKSHAVIWQVLVQIFCTLLGIFCHLAWQLEVQLARLVILGWTMGMGPSACVLAAALSLTPSCDVFRTPIKMQGQNGNESDWKDEICSKLSADTSYDMSFLKVIWRKEGKPFYVKYKQYYVGNCLSRIDLASRIAASWPGALEEMYRRAIAVWWRISFWAVATL